MRVVLDKRPSAIPRNGRFGAIVTIGSYRARGSRKILTRGNATAHAGQQTKTIDNYDATNTNPGPYNHRTPPEKGKGEERP